MGPGNAEWQQGDASGEGPKQDGLSASLPQSPPGGNERRHSEAG